MYAVEVGISLVLAVLVAGFMTHRICWGLYPLSLKMVVRNSSSWARESSLSMKMEQTECSETLAHKIQTLGNHPKESIQHSGHGRSLKSRTWSLLMFLHTLLYTM